VEISLKRDGTDEEIVEEGDEEVEKGGEGQNTDGEVEIQGEISSELSETAEADGFEGEEGQPIEGRKRKRKDKPYSSRRKLKIDEEEEEPGSEESLGEESTSTYTEMIEQALRSLGGRGTGVEITNFIDENYNHVLSNKTKTWRNSVMGCLSANRRNLFAKEPVKQNAKRYVWKLNDVPSADADKKDKTSPGSNKRRKSTGTPTGKESPQSDVKSETKSESKAKRKEEQYTKSQENSPIDETKKKQDKDKDKDKPDEEKNQRIKKRKKNKKKMKRKKKMTNQRNHTFQLILLQLPIQLISS